jgi:hypothetical protein
MSKKTYVDFFEYWKSEHQCETDKVKEIALDSFDQGVQGTWKEANITINELRAELHEKNTELAEKNNAIEGAVVIIQIAENVFEEQGYNENKKLASYWLERYGEK